MYKSNHNGALFVVPTPTVRVRHKCPALPLSRVSDQSCGRARAVHRTCGGPAVLVASTRLLARAASNDHSGGTRGASPVWHHARNSRSVSRGMHRAQIPSNAAMKCIAHDPTGRSDRTVTRRTNRTNDNDQRQRVMGRLRHVLAQLPRPCHPATSRDPWRRGQKRPRAVAPTIATRACSRSRHLATERSAGIRPSMPASKHVEATRHPVRCTSSSNRQAGYRS